MDPLTDTASVVFRALLARGLATRPELAAAVGVSKQTVSLAIAELERRGLAEQRDHRSGRVGRSPARYGLARTAGHVAGVDLGGARLRTAVAALDGTVLAEHAVDRPGREGDDAPLLAARAIGAGSPTGPQLGAGLELGAGPLLGVGVGVGRPVGRADAPDPELVGPFAPAPVWIENDVNCAAIAQVRYRSGPVPPVVLHVQVGGGVGAAVLLDGRVLHGRRGHSGEIARLPLPAGAAEARLAAPALLAAAGVHGPLRSSLDRVFDAAAGGEPRAVTALDAEAEGISELLDTCVAVLDPDLVVLSGVVGERAELRDRVLAACRGRGVFTPIVGDPLGDGATVLGAVALAVDRVLAVLAPVRVPLAVG